MDGVKVIMVDYPLDADGYAVESFDDDGQLFYTVFINARLNDERQRAAFYHEMLHIKGGDFGCDSVDYLEEKRHKEVDKLKCEFMT